MLQKFRFREHVLVYDRHDDVWELWRGLFPPGSTRVPDDEHLQKVTVEAEFETESALIEALLTTDGSTVAELSAVTKSPERKVLDLIHHLEEYDLIECFDEPTDFSRGELKRYERHLRLFSILGSKYDIQRKLRNARVVVIGLGGIGGWLTYNLASMGVGHIIGFDHDNVELSNLNRQILFGEQDIGKSKALAARERLQNYNKDIKIETYPIAITKDSFEERIPADANVVATTVFPIEYFLNAFCVRNKIAIVGQGGGGYSPSGVLVMIPYKTGCFSCIADPTSVWNDLRDRIRSRYSNTYVPTTTFSPFVSMCANIMAVEIFKIITGVAEPSHNIIINPLTWEIQRDRFKLTRRADCPVCGEQTPT